MDMQGTIEKVLEKLNSGDATDKDISAGLAALSAITEKNDVKVKTILEDLSVISKDGVTRQQEANDKLADLLAIAEEDDNEAIALVEALAVACGGKTEFRQKFIDAILIAGSSKE